LGACDVRTALLATLIGVITIAGGGQAGEAAPECGRNLIVHFPKVSLSAGERVVGMELTVVSGAVVGVSNIPLDWGIHVEPEVGGVTSVGGGPQHGVGALDSTTQLPAVVVRGRVCSTFALSAVVHVTRDFASTRRIDLEQRMLRIERTPTPTPKTKRNE
jgi:hypothetical protein